MSTIQSRIQEAVEQWKASHEGIVPDTLYLGMHEIYLLDKAEGGFVMSYLEMRIVVGDKYREIRVGRVM